MSVEFITLPNGQMAVKGRNYISGDELLPYAPAPEDQEVF